MNTQSEREHRFGVGTKELNLPFLITCATLFIVAALASAASLCSLLIPSVAKSLFLTIENSGIADIDSIIAWFAVCVGIRFFIAVFCMFYAIGLTMAAVEVSHPERETHYCGWRVISGLNRVVRWIWIFVCAGLGVAFVVRFVPYFISHINNHEGVFYIAGLFLYEGMCLTFFCIVAYILYRCFGELEDSADCMFYMFTARKICDLPPTSYAFMIVLAVMSAIFAYVSRGDIFVSLALILPAVAFIFTGVWFKRLKSSIEWIKYQEEKKKKQDNR